MPIRYYFAIVAWVILLAALFVNAAIRDVELMLDLTYPVQSSSR